MAHWVKALFGLGAAAAFAVGCGGSTSGGNGGAAPIPFDQLQDEMVEAYCGALSGCCAQASYPYDGAACRTNLGNLFSTTLPDPSRVYYDAAAAGACVQSIRAELASCGEPDGGAVCDGVFRGRVEAGGACVSDTECAGQDAECDNDVCVVSPRGTLGSPCDTTCVEESDGTSCSSFGPSTTSPGTCYRNDGLYCSQDTTSCVAVGSSGAPCTDYDGCAVGLVCLYGQTGGVCSPRVPLGGDCLNYDDCAQGFCDYDTHLCTAPRAVGQPCQGSDECQSGNCNFDTYLCEAGGGNDFASPELCAGSFGGP